MTTPTTTLTRGHKKKERTRAQLVTAAIDVIGEHGEAFKLSDVAAAAGVAHGTVYNYFTDRQDVIDTVAIETFEALTAESDAIVTSSDPVEKFAVISARGLLRAAQRPDSTRALLRLDSLQRSVIRADLFDRMRADIEAGHRSGRFQWGADDATLDLLSGGLLTASRRLIEDDVPDTYIADVVARMLSTLGIPPLDAGDIAANAVTQALELG